jgi:hypothetical protein
MVGFLKALDTPAGRTIGIIREDGVAEDCTVVDPSALVSGTLSNVWFVDKGAAAGGDGSAGRPYDTLLAAVTAHAAGGTFLLTPADYSAETIPQLTDGDWNFWGLQLGSWPEGFAAGVTPAPLSATLLPPLILGTGGGANQCSFRSVALPFTLTVRQSCALFMQDVAVDGCFTDTAPDGTVRLRADRCYFNSSGLGGTALGDCQLNDCGFFGSQQLQTNGTNVQITRSYGQTSVTFLGAAGTLNIDPFTRGALNVPALTNGTQAVVGLPVQNLTASLASPQAQINDIVAAGVVLGLWTDSRVP